MSNPLGTYDPDEENNPSIMIAALAPKNDLQKKAMDACRRTGFKNKQDRTRWRKLEDRTFGGEEHHVMYKAWMEHNIDICATANSKTTIPTRSFVVLMLMIENENRRVDWEAANKDKVMASRATLIKSRFGKKYE
jgi:hypothetical protein